MFIQENAKAIAKAREDARLARYAAQGLEVKPSGNNQGYLFKQICPDCQKEMWRTKGQIGTRCRECALKVKKARGAANYRWNGGRTVLPSGYVYINLSLDSPYLPMATKNKTCDSYRMFEHRFVMAQHLGRCLDPWEIVHHKNGLRGDNRLENLELMPHQANHLESIMMVQEINRLRARIAELEAQLAALPPAVEKI